VCNGVLVDTYGYAVEKHPEINLWVKEPVSNHVFDFRANVTRKFAYYVKSVKRK